MLSWLSWRQRIDIHALQAQDFPEELFDSDIVSVVLSENPDKDCLVYISVKKYRKISDDVTNMVVRLLILCTELIASKLKPNQLISVVIDAADLTHSNVDVRLVKKMASIWLNYCSPLIRSFTVVNANFAIRLAMKVIMKVFPSYLQSLITLSDCQGLIRHFGSHNVPSSLTGTGSNVQRTAIFKSSASPKLADMNELTISSLDKEKLRQLLIESE
ncbi:hypothetical protein HDE_09206 [Halotydeus destructor]|nr:hypothetical protein HDE_09206 [Halotydeus destructor]